mmetsp:Transcript_22938/g.52546  ORF Transcript_22938/g.52546 Transcript_22938/m.52546 type:complete len:132 (-) Transcript_22938:213-608(-)
MGTFWAGVVTAWTTPPVSDPRGLMPAVSTDFRQLTSTIGRQAFKLGAVGVLFAGTDCLMEEFRNGKKDRFNSVCAGFVAGAYLGLRQKRFDYALGTAVAGGFLSFLGDLPTITEPHGMNWMGKEFPPPQKF